MHAQPTARRPVHWRKQRQAAELLASGSSPAEVVTTIGESLATLRRWQAAEPVWWSYWREEAERYLAEAAPGEWLAGDFAAARLARELVADGDQPAAIRLAAAGLIARSASMFRPKPDVVTREEHQAALEAARLAAVDDVIAHFIDLLTPEQVAEMRRRAARKACHDAR